MKVKIFVYKFYFSSANENYLSRFKTLKERKELSNKKGNVLLPFFSLDSRTFVSTKNFSPSLFFEVLSYPEFSLDAAWLEKLFERHMYARFLFGDTTFLEKRSSSNEKNLFSSSIKKR